MYMKQFASTLESTLIHILAELSECIDITYVLQYGVSERLEMVRNKWLEGYVYAYVCACLYVCLSLGFSGWKDKGHQDPEPQPEPSVLGSTNP